MYCLGRSQCPRECEHSAKTPEKYNHLKNSDESWPVLSVVIAPVQGMYLILVIQEVNLEFKSSSSAELTRQAKLPTGEGN